MKKSRQLSPTIRLLLVFVVMALGILLFFFTLSRILIHKPEHSSASPFGQAGAASASLVAGAVRVPH